FLSLHIKHHAGCQGIKAGGLCSGKSAAIIGFQKKCRLPEMPADQKLRAAEQKIRENVIPAISLPAIKCPAGFPVPGFKGCDPSGIPLAAGFEQGFDYAGVKPEPEQLILYPLVILVTAAGVELGENRKACQENKKPPFADAFKKAVGFIRHNFRTSGAKKDYLHQREAV
ncbi:MAG: hypothetical protein ACLFQ9_07755, partial [Desulfobacterales bacterium]